MLIGLDLFSGYGGLSLALSEWVRPAAYCEISRFAQGILLSRMADGVLFEAPIWDDVKTLKSAMLPIRPDIIYGGPPFEDFSRAAARHRLGGERRGLLYELLRLVEDINPRFVFLENLPAIRTRGLREIVTAFTDLRYDCRWTCVDAAEVGAPHRRPRFFLLARFRHERGGFDYEGADTAADPDIEGLEVAPGVEGEEVSAFERGDWTSGNWWADHARVCRVSDDAPARVERLRCLGRGVVPLQAKTAFERLMGLSQEPLAFRDGLQYEENVWVD